VGSQQPDEADGVVEAAGDRARPTGAGPDLSGIEDVARDLGTAFTSHVRERAAAAQAARDAVLASDSDRDAAVKVLADAFSVGRLSSAELEQRTGRALAARTHGELDDLLAGLGGYRVAVPSRPWRKAVFGVVAFLTSPFVLLGSLLFAFGSDAGDHVGGAVFLVVLLPGLLALWRWAWPRR
jgi:hypothetical protein